MLLVIYSASVDIRKWLEPPVNLLLRCGSNPLNSRETGRQWVNWPFVKLFRRRSTREEAVRGSAGGFRRHLLCRFMIPSRSTNEASPFDRSNGHCFAKTGMYHGVKWGRGVPLVATCIHTFRRNAGGTSPSDRIVDKKGVRAARQDSTPKPIY